MLLGLGIGGNGVAGAHDVLIAERVIHAADVWPELSLAQPVDGEGRLVARVRVVPFVSSNHLYRPCECGAVFYTKIINGIGPITDVKIQHEIQMNRNETPSAFCTHKLLTIPAWCAGR